MKPTLVPSGYFGKSSDWIVTVENLLSQEEADLLLNVAKNLDIWNDSPYRNKYSNLDKLQEASPEAHQLIEQLSQRWHKHVSAFYNADLETYFNPLCKWAIGNDQKPHADKEWEDGTPADQNHYDIGSVIYLNDDYEGGEIYFTQHDISIKPKARSASAFPGDKYFLHGVTKVEKAERYTIPIFWTVKQYEKDKDQTLG
jgi:predicted 2-oxoglutarate/Fe(II)-dependent dioxygenase YbiX